MGQCTRCHEEKPRKDMDWCPECGSYFCLGCNPCPNCSG